MNRRFSYKMMTYLIAFFLFTSSSLWALDKYTSVPAKLSEVPSGAYSFVVYGDTRNNYSVHSDLISLMLQEKPKLVFHVGDIVDIGQNEKEWQQTLKIMEPLFSAVGNENFLLAIGNHECKKNQSSKAMFAKYFNKELIKGHDGAYYSVAKTNECNCYFIVLDTNLEKSSDHKQRTWLEAELKKADGFKHTFIFTHVPFWGATGHGSNKNLQKNYWPIIEKHKNVRLIFSGHNHIYERIKRVNASKTVNVIVGTGGAPLNGVEYEEFSDVVVNQYGYGRVFIWENNVYFAAYDLKNKVIDSFLW